VNWLPPSQMFTMRFCKYGHIAPRYIHNSNCVACNARRRAENPEIYREYQRKARAKYTPERQAELAAYVREWHKANHKHVREWFHHNHAKRQASDPQYRIKRALCSNLNLAIARSWRSGSAIKNLGCSIAELRAHLEAQFEPEMNWDNYGRLNKKRQTWQIDHIRPLASFDLIDPMQVAQVCHYSNLRPMWAIANLRKGGKE
jgi:hypothetical protein